MDVTPRPDPGGDVGTPSVDAGPDLELDLTPRPPVARRRRRWPAVAAVAVIVAALGFVMYRGLGDATMYFYNADEAVAQRAELGDDRFRLQGTVEADSVVDTGDGVAFTVVYHGVEVDVAHRGDPPELFQEGIPVVVEGRWGAGDRFESDLIRVKHSEVYEEENSDRLKEAETEAEDSAPTP